ncbi:MAG: DUF6776 family protein [Pseudomonadales bacterium]
MRVVSHHPWRRALLVASVMALSGLGSFGGYRFGLAVADLDQTYVAALERLNESNQQAIEKLQAQLVEAGLNRHVDVEAAAALRESIKSLRDELASLNQEVTFYKSLMSPSSVARGLQIADFELLKMEQSAQYTYHVLLTQVESRRDWVQGNVEIAVHGRMIGTDSATIESERVLPLTDIAQDDGYPLKFRFRYFQDLTGVITLPDGFEPSRIVVSAARRGAKTADLSRTFEWLVSGQEST